MTANYIQDAPFNQEMPARRPPPKAPEFAYVDRSRGCAGLSLPAAIVGLSFRWSAGFGAAGRSGSAMQRTPRARPDCHGC